MKQSDFDKLKRLGVEVRPIPISVWKHRSWATRFDLISNRLTVRIGHPNEDAEVARVIQLATDRKYRLAMIGSAVLAILTFLGAIFGQSIILGMISGALILLALGLQHWTGERARLAVINAEPEPELPPHTD